MRSVVPHCIEHDVAIRPQPRPQRYEAYVPDPLIFICTASVHACKSMPYQRPFELSKAAVHGWCLFCARGKRNRARAGKLSRFRGGTRNNGARVDR
eukprot:scaffold38971_cov64-Phaeocystis_antarctica.AAC.1